MNDIVRKIFDMLGVEPYEEFKIIPGEKDINNTRYFITEDLEVRFACYALTSQIKLIDLLNGTYKIVKLPKKKKLKDLTEEEYRKWKNKNCDGECNKCLFNLVQCYVADNGWVNHKDLYSDKFLDQEVEIPE